MSARGYNPQDGLPSRRTPPPRTNNPPKPMGGWGWVLAPSLFVLVFAAIVVLAVTSDDPPPRDGTDGVVTEIDAPEGVRCFVYDVPGDGALEQFDCVR